MAFATVEELVQEIAKGRMVILIDAPDRENEGDLVMAAELVTDEHIKFCALEGRGLICAPMAAFVSASLASALASAASARA